MDTSKAVSSEPTTENDLDKTRPEDGEDEEDEESDELDELDDLLDQFNANSIAPTVEKALKDDKAGQDEQPSLGSLDDDFARQLQQGMADLLKEMEESPDFQAQFDSLMQELDKTTNVEVEKPRSTQVDAGSEGESSKMAQNRASIPEDTKSATFHETIAKTMERMQESGAEIDTEMADSNTDDFLGEMLRQMQASTGQGGSDEDFSQMLMGMMEQLTNKDILFEPMKELNDKFPTWLVENEGKQSAEEMAKYREQARLVGEIVDRFEQPGYSDTSESDRAYIVERMQKMQAVGSPPAELLGDVSQSDGLPADIENCPVQ